MFFEDYEYINVNINNKRWCPDGCGKSVETLRKSRTTTYRCCRCKKIFNIDDLKKLNNMKK
jgi:hypothetical protein